jgi:hypothetical protein
MPEAVKRRMWQRKSQRIAMNDFRKDRWEKNRRAKVLKKIKRPPASDRREKT